MSAAIRHRARAHRRAVSPEWLTRPTGTDPSAKYTAAGFEDKSIGQAVTQDTELAERLLAESHGDKAEAERRFLEESAGAPKLQSQERETGAGLRPSLAMRGARESYRRRDPSPIPFSGVAGQQINRRDARDTRASCSPPFP